MGARAVLVVALLGITAPTTEGQTLPPEVIRSTLEYFEAKESGRRIAVETQRFPDLAALETAARGLDLRLGTGSEVRICHDAPPPDRMCELVDADVLLNLYQFEVTAPGREVEVQMIVSRTVRVDFEGEELVSSSASLRRITLRNEGGWSVVGDEPMMIG